MYKIECLLFRKCVTFRPTTRGAKGNDPTVVMSEARNRILHTFGNLTVLTQELNSSVSNSLWEIKASALLQAIALAARTVMQAQGIRTTNSGLGRLLWFLLFRTFGRKLHLLQNGPSCVSTRDRLINAFTFHAAPHLRIHRPQGVVTRGELVVLAETIIEGDSIIQDANVRTVTPAATCSLYSAQAFCAFQFPLAPLQ